MSKGTARRNATVAQAVAAALQRHGVGLVFGQSIPSLLHLGDNYLAAGFRQYNPNLFPVPLLVWVDGHPDGVVWAAAAALVLAGEARLLADAALPRGSRSEVGNGLPGGWPVTTRPRACAG